MKPNIRVFDREFDMMLEVAAIDFMKEEVTVIRDNWWDDDRHDRLPMSRVDVVQSTGMTDINGVEIYEGHIVKADHENFSEDDIEPEYEPYIGVVTYEDAAYIIRTKKGYDPYLSNIRITGIEVIGNIYTQPHLMEGIE